MVLNDNAAFLDYQANDQNPRSRCWTVIRLPFTGHFRRFGGGESDEMSDSSDDEAGGEIRFAAVCRADRRRPAMSISVKPLCMSELSYQRVLIRLERRQRLLCFRLARV